MLSQWMKTLRSITRKEIHPTFIEYLGRSGRFVIGDTIDHNSVMLKYKRHGAKNTEWLRIGPTKRGMQMIYCHRGRIHFGIKDMDINLGRMISKFLGYQKGEFIDREYEKYSEFERQIYMDIDQVLRYVFGLPEGLYCRTNPGFDMDNSVFHSLGDTFIRIKYPNLDNLMLSRTSRMRKHIQHESTVADVFHSVCKGKKVLKRILMDSGSVDQISIAEAVELLLRKRDAKKKDWNVGYISSLAPLAIHIPDFAWTWDAILKHYNPKVVINRLRGISELDQDQSQMMIRDTVVMLRSFKIRGVPYDLPRRMPSFRQLHDEIVRVDQHYADQLSKEERDAERSRTLNTEYYSELDGIEVMGTECTLSVPSTYGDLMDTGKMLANCVSTYAPSVQKGEILVITMKNGGNDRYCAEIGVRDYRYELVQISGYKNSKVKSDIVQKFIRTLSPYMDIWEPERVEYEDQHGID